MKIDVYSATSENDYREALVIFIDNARVFSIYEGEPEDNNLGRNFNNCWIVPDLLKKTFLAGAANPDEEVSITTHDVSWDDLP